MTVDYILLVSQIKNRKPLDITQIDTLKNAVMNCEYPIGMFPSYILESNPLYTTQSIESNINYFESWISGIYGELYTEQEIYIISIYLSLFTYVQFTLPQSVLILIDDLLSVASQKKEIQYFLEEIKYNYLGTLLYSNSSDTETINTLLNELRAIEVEHNFFEKELVLNRNVLA